MDNIVFSAAPVVAREKARLVRRVPGATPVEDRLELFEEELVWLRETEASLTLLHRGVEVKSLAAFNDYYGFLRSVDAALEAIPGFCGHYRITPDSELALQLDLIVTDSCVLPALGKAAWGGKRAYRALPACPTWWRATPEILDQWAGTALEQRGELLAGLQVISHGAVGVASHPVVWHSVRDACVPSLGEEGEEVLAKVRHDIHAMAAAS